MSIAESLTALQNAKTAIKNSIIAKGVVVSDSDGYADFSSKIDAISGGGGITPTGTININENGTFDVTQYASALVNVAGGGSDLPSNYHTGSFTLDGSESEKVFAHGCSVTPTIVFVVCDSISTSGETNKTVASLLAGTHELGIIINYQGVIGTALDSWGTMTADNTNATFKPRASYPFKAGAYHWIAIE